MFEAIDGRGRRAAVKQLAEPAGDEWRALCSVTHPAMVAGLDSSAHPVPYIAMELAPGDPLSIVLTPATRLADARIIDIGGSLASVLEAVHTAGIHHGDVKPDNVVLDPHTGLVRLVDFGLSGRPTGGTLSYVAPEILAKGPGGPQADIYSLGMTLWALLHARRPPSDSQAMFQRLHQAPPVERGPAWLSTLLADMLSPRSQERPTASQIVDVFSANGARIPEPDAGLIHRRAASVSVPRPGVLICAAAWLDQGGSVALVGADGTGRTHTLRYLAQELAARGQTHAWIRSTPQPRGALAVLLNEASLPGPPVALPVDPSPTAQARLTADAVQARASGPLFLLVDDLEALDADTRAAVELLCQRSGVNVAIGAQASPEFVQATLELGPVPASATREQIVGLLGSADDRFAELVHRESGGLPGAVVDAVLGAIRGGALVYRRSRWIFDPARMDELVARGELRVPASDTLSPDASTVGAVLALSPESLSKAELSALSDLAHGAVEHGLRELVDIGWVEGTDDGAFRCATSGARRALQPDGDDAVRVHRLLAERIVSNEVDAPATLLEHLIGGGDEERLRPLGAALLDQVARTDRVRAAGLARSLWQACPDVEGLPILARALIKGDQPTDAASLIEHGLKLAETAEQQGALLVQRSLMHARAEDWQAALADLVQVASLTPHDVDFLCAKAEVSFRAGRFDDARRSAMAVASGPAPSEPEAVDRWLQMRASWAQSTLRLDGPAAALEVLDDVPPGLAADRTAGAVVEGVRGRLCWHAGDLRAASIALRRAAASPAALSTSERSKLRNNAALALYQSGLLGEAIDYWEQALLGFERLGDSAEQLRVQINLCQGLREVGRFDRAAELGERALLECRDRGLTAFELVLLGNLGDLAVARKNWAEADRRFSEAEAHATELRDASALAELARRRAELAAVSREPDFIAIASHAVEAAVRAEATFDQARSAALLALARVRDHKPVDLESELNDASGPLRGNGAAGDLAAVRRWFAQAMLEDGRSRRAIELATEAAAWAEEVGHVQLRRAADQIISEARTAGGVNDAGPLQRLVRTSIKLSRIREPDALLTAVADAAIDIIEVERAFVLVLAHDGEVRVAASTVTAMAPAGQPSMSVVRRALDQRREVLATDLEERRDLRTAASIQALELRAALCVPLLDGPDLLGAIYIDSGNAVQNPLIEAAAHLRALAAFAATALADRRRQAETRRRAEHGADLVHDVRNLLTGVGLLLDEIVEDKAAADWALQDAADNLVALGRANELLRRFLNRATVQPQRIDLRSMVDDVLAQLRPLSRANGVVLTCSGADTAFVLADPHELPRAMTNLVENAIKHGQTGERVDVTIDLVGDEVVLCVRDRGPGLPTLDDGVLSSKVRRLTVQPGHGRGLAIARRVIESHGGRVEADNDPTGGARMTVYLPVDRPDT